MQHRELAERTADAVKRAKEVAAQWQKEELLLRCGGVVVGGGCCPCRPAARVLGLCSRIRGTVAAVGACRSSQRARHALHNVAVVPRRLAPRGRRQQLSLYTIISKVNWRTDAGVEGRVAGTVSDPSTHEIRPFDFDPHQASHFETVNKLWQLLM